MKIKINQYNLFYLIIIIFLLLILLLIGAFFLIDKYFLLKPIPNNFNQEVNKNEVIVDFVLSSLSKPKGKIDVLWNLEKTQTSTLSKEFTAEPLDLIEELKINNNSSDSIFFYGINNEQTNLLRVRSFSEEIALWEPTLSGPFMLLPNKFYDDRGNQVECIDRDINNLLRNVAYFMKPFFYQNNVCHFKKPIEIKAKSSLVLKPEIYAIRFGFEFSDVLTNIFSGKNKKFIEANIDGKTWLVPKWVENEISGQQSFSLGGFIVANTKDEELINNILKIKNKNGQSIRVKIGKLEQGIPIKSYKIPGKVFIPSLTNFDENILGMQAFWYINNFWSAENITGKYDSSTIAMLKRFQKEMKLAETGKFDQATIWIMNAFDKDLVYYENYEDGEVVVSFDSFQPYFRFFSRGMNLISLNKDTSSSSLIVKLAKKPNVETSEYSYDDVFAYSLDNKEIFTLGGVAVLNNTLETKRCYLINDKGIVSKVFLIEPNTIYPKEEINKGITDSKIHYLKCDDKSMEIEISPDVNN